MAFRCPAGVLQFANNTPFTAYLSVNDSGANLSSVAFGGFKFVIIEDRAEGGLTEAANVVDSYFFSQDAVGLAIGIDIKTDVDWIADRTSWLCNGMLKAGAVSRDGSGIVKVQYKDNV